MTKNKLFVFIHIPKTAGTTLRAIIQRQYKPDNIYRIHWNFDRSAPYADFLQLPAQKRAKIRVVYGHIPFGLHQKVDDNVIYFTILRNPIDRCISHYYYIRRLPRHFHYKNAQSMDLGEFVASGVFREMDNGQVRQLTASGHLPFGTCTPALLEQAIANLERHFCVVGLQERFDESVVLLRRALGWKIPPLYRRRNVGRRPSAEAGLSAETLRIVQEHNALDLQLYEYALARLERTIHEQGPGFALELQLFRAANRAASALVGWWRQRRPRAA